MLNTKETWKKNISKTRFLTLPFSVSILTTRCERTHNSLKIPVRTWMMHDKCGKWEETFASHKYLIKSLFAEIARWINAPKWWHKPKSWDEERKERIHFVWRHGIQPNLQMHLKFCSLINKPLLNLQDLKHYKMDIDI